MIRRIFGAAALLLCLAAAGQAQSDYRLEVFGSVGAAEYLVIFAPSIHGTNFGGGVGYRPFSAKRTGWLRMLGLEFELNGTRIPARYGTGMQGYFTGNVLFHIPKHRIEPYLVLGVGGSREAGETHQAATAGIGARVFFTSHISVRSELRAFATEYLGSFARESVGVGYHW